MTTVSSAITRRILWGGAATAAIAAATLTATGTAPLTALSSALTTAATAARSGGLPRQGFPAHYAAPYIDTSTANPAIMAATLHATHAKYYTLAFVTATKAQTCQATWNQTTPVTSGFWNAAINQLRNAAGDVIPPFGGAAGPDLARPCRTATSLETQYRKVI